MADEGTFATTAEIGRKAGDNASSTAIAEAYTNDFIKQVESEINNHSYWKTALQIKKCPHHSTLTKFRKTFNSTKIHEIFLKIVALLHSYNILKDYNSSI